MMGESIMMITKDMGRPVPFYPPSYTKKFDASKAVDRKIKNLKEGFWWVELGSPKDIIADREKNRHDLMAYFYGVWDYVKIQVSIQRLQIWPWNGWDPFLVSASQDVLWVIIF